MSVMDKMKETVELAERFEVALTLLRAGRSETMRRLYNHDHYVHLIIDEVENLRDAQDELIDQIESLEAEVRALTERLEDDEP